MNKDWLHFPSLGRTIDLNVVSEIQWNKQTEYNRKYNQEFRTVIFLGTSIGNEDGINSYNEMSILEDEDRKKLYAKFPGIPIDLLLNEAPIEEDSVESLAPSNDNCDDIPF